MATSKMWHHGTVADPWSELGTLWGDSETNEFGAPDFRHQQWCRKSISFKLGSGAPCPSGIAPDV